MIFRLETEIPFRVASGRASGIITLPNQTCGTNHCGDPCDNGAAENSF